MLLLPSTGLGSQWNLCMLHAWQLSCITTVAWEWNGYQNSQYRKFNRPFQNKIPVQVFILIFYSVTPVNKTGHRRQLASNFIFHTSKFFILCCQLINGAVSWDIFFWRFPFTVCYWHCHYSFFFCCHKVQHSVGLCIVWLVNLLLVACLLAWLITVGLLMLRMFCCTWTAQCERLYDHTNKQQEVDLQHQRISQSRFIFVWTLWIHQNQQQVLVMW